MFAFAGFLMGGVEEWVVKTYKILMGKNTLRESHKKDKLPFDARKPVLPSGCE